jgi:hypothetical protein
MNMKIVWLFVGTLFISTEAMAIQYCKLEVKNGDGKVTYTKMSSRGEDFFDSIVNKLDDCDTCRRNGREHGPKNCASDSKEYVITCQKNGGDKKDWNHLCP